MSVSVLLPVLLTSGDVSEVFFVDFSTMEVYNTRGEVASEDQSREIVSEMISQQEESIPRIPHDRIREVLGTERELSAQNAEHFYNRSL